MRLRHPSIGLALAFAALFPAQAWSATPEQFLACDGYRTPTKEALDDGLRIRALSYPWYNPDNWVDARRAPLKDNAESVAACDAAIDAVPDNQWVRKVSLLEARALHRLYNENFDAALEDLKLAEQAGHADDPYYARSLGLDLQFARAYILRRKGDQEGAEKIALDAVAKRPFNRQTLTSAMTALGPRPSLNAKTQIIRRIGALQPTAIVQLFFSAFGERNFGEMVALYPNLVPNLEVGESFRDTEKAALEWRNFRRVEIFWAEMTGSYAYALTALGRETEATAAMEGARKRLADNTAPPEDLPANTRSKEKIAIHQGLVDIRVRVAKEAGELLDNWARAIERRNSIAQGKALVVAGDLTQHPLPINPASVELVEMMNKDLPPGQRLPDALGNEIKARFEAARPDKFPSLFPFDLIARQVDAETSERIPPYEFSNAGFLAMTGSNADRNEEGYRNSKPGADGVISVSYRGISGSRAMTEEMALLRAAELARAAGKKGIVVTDRRDVNYTFGMAMWGTMISSDVNGFYAMMDVTFVDLAALPPSYAGEKWRVLDADEVYAQLAPLYPQPKSKEAKKN